MHAVTPGLNSNARALVHVVYGQWLLVGVEVVRKVDRVAPLLHSLLCPLSLSHSRISFFLFKPLCLIFLLQLLQYHEFFR
jgi:hypothetical protein